MVDRARALIISEGKILLIHRFKRGREFYVAPGGRIDEGETPAQTAVREAKEETSLDITIGPEAFCLEDENDNGKKRKHHYFTVTSFTGTVKLGGEEAEKHCAENQFLLEWVPLERLDQLPFYDEHIKAKFVALSRGKTN